MSIESEIVTWVEGLLSTELFQNPDGGVISPQVKEGDLDPKEAENQDDNEFPFVLVRTNGGSVNARTSNMSIEIIGGIWANDDVQSGFDSIKRLNGLLQGIVREKGSFSFRLVGDVAWFYGVSKEKGRQPHPYYFVTLLAQFSGTPERTTCTG